MNRYSELKNTRQFNLETLIVPFIDAKIFKWLRYFFIK